MKATKSQSGVSPSNCDLENARTNSFEPCLLISLFSLPFGREVEFNKALQSTLSNYLDKVTKTDRGLDRRTIAKDQNKGFEELNCSISYLTWGNFDLAFLCSIDNFDIIHEFACVENHHAQQFLICRPITDEGVSIINGKWGFFDDAVVRQHPLVGICNLKLNPIWSSILGNKLANGFFRYFSDQFPKKKFADSIIYPFRSYSWGEIQLIVFSTNYREIVDALISLRELTLERAFGMGNDGGILEEILSSKITSSLMTKPAQAKHNHMFVTSYTTLGFNLDRYRQVSRLSKGKSSVSMHPLHDLNSIDPIYFLTEVACRPGHMNSAQTEILFAQPGRNKKAFIIPGKQDFLIAKVDQELNIRPQEQADAIYDFAKIHSNLSSSSNILKTKTSLIVPRAQAGDIVSKKHASYFSRFLGKPLSWRKKIALVKKNMVRLGFPKNVIYELEHLLSMYLNCIQNYRVLDAFSEYHYFVQNLIRFLLNIKKGTQTGVFAIRLKGTDIKEQNKGEIVRLLISIMQLLKEAFETKYFLSYAMNEFTDFSVEFRGSNHQIISAINGVHMALLSFLEEKSLRNGFVIISGEPNTRTHATLLGSIIKLNYHSVFEPLELFPLYHEIAHYLFATIWYDLKQSMTDNCKKQNAIKKDKYSLLRSMEQTFADVFSFNLGYLRKKDPYSKLFWARFRISAEIDQEDLDAKYVTVLCRFVLSINENLWKYFHTYRLCSKESRRGVKRLILTEILNEVIAIKKYERHVANMYESYEKGEEKGRDYFHRVFIKCYIWVTTFFANHQQLLRRLKTFLGKAYPGSYLDNGVFKVSSLYDKEIEDIKIHLRKGKSYPLCKSARSHMDLFRSAQKALYACFEEGASYIDKDCPFISEKNGNVKLTGASCLYFDPTGGMLARNPDFRKQYMNFKLAAFETFLEISQAIKQKIILETIENKL